MHLKGRCTTTDTKPRPPNQHAKMTAIGGRASSCGFEGCRPRKEKQQWQDCGCLVDQPILHRARTYGLRRLSHGSRHVEQTYRVQHGCATLRPPFISAFTSAWQEYNSTAADDFIALDYPTTKSSSSPTEELCTYMHVAMPCESIPGNVAVSSATSATSSTTSAASHGPLNHINSLR